MSVRTRRGLLAEIQELRARLDESEELKRAIRAGEVDAFLIADEKGERVLTVDGADSAYRVLVETMNEGAAILRDEGTLLYCNGRLASMLKAPLESVMGDSLARFVAEGDREHFDALIEGQRLKGCSGEITLCCSDGARLPVQLSLSPMKIHGQEGICLVATDLTERMRAEDELRSLSLVDSLTGLYNRRGFFTLGEQQLKMTRRLDGKLLLVFGDLDDLKMINDSLGHLQGDQALVDVADVLRHTFRESDTIARMGGDEFAVLATSTQGIDAMTLTLRLQSQLAARNAIGDRDYLLSMSVGIVRCDTESLSSIEDLIKQADAAMYEQKRGHHAQRNGARPD